jgi:cytochrome P450
MDGLLSRLFAPGRVRDAEPMLRDLMLDLLDAVAGEGGCDTARDIAAPLATLGFCRYLGWPGEDAARIAAWAQPGTVHGRVERRTQLHGYFAALTAARAVRPAGDAISELLAAAGSDQQARDRVTVACTSIAIGGLDATRRVLVAALAQVAMEDAKRKRRLADPLHATALAAALVGDEVVVGRRLGVALVAVALEELHRLLPDYRAAEDGTTALAWV